MRANAIPKLRSSRVPVQSPGDALVSSLAAGVDRSLMRAVSLIVERRVLPRDADLDSLRESIRSMLASGLADDPGQLFDFVRALESDSGMAPTRSRSLARTPPGGGKILRRRVTSSYRTHPQLPGTDHPLDSIAFEHWVHGDGRERGTVIALHGFAMGWPAIDGRALSARQWFELGLDVVLLTLPEHGPRRPRGAFFSGQSYTVPHAMHLAGAVRRAVHEIFEVKRWLRERSDKPVGLFGMSLGGYLSSLCAGLSADFDFLCPLVPPACMGDLAWRVYRDTEHHRNAPDQELTEDAMRAAFYVHSPLAHPRRMEREKILILAGAGDRIVPPEHPTALWEHWERPPIHWFRGSHMAPAAGGGLMPRLSEHLHDLDILP